MRGNEGKGAYNIREEKNGGKGDREWHVKGQKNTCKWKVAYVKGAMEMDE